MKTKSKDAKIQAVATSALKLMVEHSPSNVTVSSLSRMSGVSRAWIYEYYGKSKNEILETTAKHWGIFFSRAGKFENPVSANELKNRIVEGNNFVLAIALENPTIIKSYFKFRGQQELLSDVINQYYNQTFHYYYSAFKTVMKFTDERALSAAQLLLITRMGCAHHILTQTDKTQALNFGTKVCNEDLLGNWFT